MGFQIVKAEIEDMEAIGEMMVQLSTSPRISLEFKDCKREDGLDWNVACVRSELLACEKFPDEAIAIKAVDDENGTLAGYAVWGWSSRTSDLINQGKADLPLPRGTNTALRTTFVTALHKLEKEHHPSHVQVYELLELVTSPSYQRRGIGSQLVRYGLAKADRDNAVVYLSGSPMGVPVYKKLGFKEVGRLEMGLGEFGGEGTHVHVAMVRTPNVIE